MTKYREQENDLIFALDVGTRSIVGVVGKQTEGRFKVLAIESAEHAERSMQDGQIDNIQRVAELARSITEKLESRLDVRLTRVCVAAAGRALRTQRGSFAIEFPENQTIDSEQISQLEAGAVTAAEEAMQGGDDARRQFFLVGYSVAQYRLDNYPLNSLQQHNGRKAEVDVVATFLPGEVVESLYAAMRTAGLQISSLTLEPIAAMNAAIPAELRLLNLTLVDIGAGTTDIAVCRDGSIVGYTMATQAGDKVTEAIMRHYLVDFDTAEHMKRDLVKDEIRFTDILGIDQKVPSEDVRNVVREPMDKLAAEIARQITAVNGTAPSAVFLAGGGSRLKGLRERVAECLEMDEKRVAVAGSNFSKSAWSDDYDLNNPEYATPLGIAVSAGLGLLNDSYVVMLNGKPAKLFRSGMLTVQDILLMNGHNYTEILGKSGSSLTLTLDGRHMVFRGEPAVPAVLRVNGEEVPLTTVIHAGDKIEFIPARSGKNAEMTLEGLLGADFSGKALVNNREAPMNQALNRGDVVLTMSGFHTVKLPEPEPPIQIKMPMPLNVILNGKSLTLEPKDSGNPYYLMDLLQHTDIDFEHIDGTVYMEVNGKEAGFQQQIKDNDKVTIRCEKRQ